MKSETVDSLLEEGRYWLSRAPLKPARREVHLLLAHVLEMEEARLLARGDQPVAEAETARFRHLLGRRFAGEPVAYLLGRREFYGRDFAVDTRVLIPRPETEHIVEAALELELPDGGRVVDVGTGSGCLAVTLACERPDLTVIAMDLDPAALAVARANAVSHDVHRRVPLCCGDLATALDLGRVDLVVSNPPYVATGTHELISTEVLDYEPHLALFAPGRGRSLLRRLLDDAEALRPGVHLLLEIGFDQAEWIEESAAGRDFLELVKLIRDYGGHRRTAVIRRR